MTEYRHHHLGHEAQLNLGEVRRAVSSIHGFNARTAVLVAGTLGSMAFFWLTVCLALFSLPAVLTTVDTGLGLGVGLATFFPKWLINASLIGLVAWIAQTFVQLIALPVLQVSSNAQARQQDHDTKILLEDGSVTREQTARLLDLMDLGTKGGFRVLADNQKQVLKALKALNETVSGRSDP